jgi:radical SAM superfamily enzyme YgiQ (UPF0313 family)
MSILLIEPPPAGKGWNIRQTGSIGTAKANIIWPPIDLMRIAGYLRKSGIASSIYDATAFRSSAAEVYRKIKDKRPRLVLFNTSTTTIKSDIKIAEIAKTISKDILTAAIGAHIIGIPVETLEEFENLDLAIFDDPESVVLELVRNNFNPENTRGLCYRKQLSIVRNPGFPVVEDLDEFGFPAHDIVPIHAYRDPLTKRRPMTIVSGQRGCINRCNYCMATLYGRNRRNSVGHFIEELRLVRGLGIREVFIIDCGFTNDMPWAHEVLDQMIQYPIDLTWWCTARSDCLDKELLLKMKRAGAHSIAIGAESADLEIIKKARKNITPETVKKVVREGREVGLEMMAFFLFGLQGETPQSLKATMDFALTLDTDLVTFGIVTPAPGTDFYNYIRENHYFVTNDWSRFDPMLPPVFNYPALTSKDIYGKLKMAYRRFYLRPGYLFRRLRKLRSPFELWNNMGNFISIFKTAILNRRGR